jgi:hypothetical protein
MEGGKTPARVAIFSPISAPDAKRNGDQDQMKEIPTMKRTALLAISMSAIAAPALAHGDHNERWAGLSHIVIHNPGVVLLAALAGILIFAVASGMTGRAG